MTPTSVWDDSWGHRTPATPPAAPAPTQDDHRAGPGAHSGAQGRTEASTATPTPATDGPASQERPE